VDRSVRLGLELPALPDGATSADVAAWAAVAVAADQAGIGAVWVTGTGHDPCTLAAGLVGRTDRVTLGVVGDLDGGRHPAVLARDVTCLDLLSGGRSAVLLTLPADRSDGLAEAVAICRALFDGDTPHVDGQHYSVAGAVNRPLPTRPGGPPVFAEGAAHLPVDGLVTTAPANRIADRRAFADRAVVWRGSVPDAATADSLRRAGVDGVIASVSSAADVGPLAELLLDRWPD